MAARRLFGPFETQTAPNTPIRRRDTPLASSESPAQRQTVDSPHRPRFSAQGRFGNRTAGNRSASARRQIVNRRSPRSRAAGTGFPRRPVSPSSGTDAENPWSAHAAVGSRADNPGTGFPRRPVSPSSVPDAENPLPAPAPPRRGSRRRAGIARNRPSGKISSAGRMHRRSSRRGNPPLPHSHASRAKTVDRTKFFFVVRKSSIPAQRPRARGGRAKRKRSL